MSEEFPMSKDKAPEIKEMSEESELITSGIAERLLENIKKYSGTHEPEITFGVEDCKFYIEEKEDVDPSGDMCNVVIEIPNLRKGGESKVRHIFGISEDGTNFGGESDEPLTVEQISIIKEMFQKKMIPKRLAE